MSVSVILSAISCQHEIPGINDSPGSGLAGAGANTPPAASTCSADTIYFRQQVLPVFISNCAMSGCHDDASHKEGIVLTSYSGIMAGGIHAGNPAKSKIYKLISTTKPDDRMPQPPRNPLSQEQIGLIGKWIEQGAKNNSCVNANCDTANSTYSASIRYIISDNCLGCHSGPAPADGYDFSTYAGLKAKVNDGRLWGAINHVAGYPAMPKNGTQLSACERIKIKMWIDAGAPNN